MPEVSTDRAGRLASLQDAIAALRQAGQPSEADQVHPGSLEGLCLHALRATAATNALDHDSDIARVRSGLATRTSRRPGSTIAVGRSRRTPPPSR